MAMQETTIVSATERTEAWSGETLPRWPENTIRNLLGTSLVTDATRAALHERLERSAVEEPRSLSPEAFLTLRAVCGRLIPQPERGDGGMVDIAGAIDRELAEGKGNGWRYASLPPDGEAYEAGLRGVGKTARAMFGAPFRSLDPARQDAVLAAMQAGAAPGPTWASMPANRFFEELLVLATETYYAHPLAQEEIGYAGMADAAGWQAIGLDEREAHEPAPLDRATGAPHLPADGQASR